MRPWWRAPIRVGRLVDAIENLGELDNTLFIYISGDNGGSSIGDINGVFVEWGPLNNAPEDIPYLLSRLDEYGGPASYPIIWTVGSSSRMTGGRCRIPLVERWPFALVRGRRTPQAILAGVFFPATWMAWYVSDQLPLRRAPGGTATDARAPCRQTASALRR